MYENYLLNLNAMSFVLSQADSSGLTSVTPEDVLIGYKVMVTIRDTFRRMQQHH